MTGQSFGSIVSNVEVVASPTPSSSVSPKETAGETPIVTQVLALLFKRLLHQSTSETSIPPKPSPQVQADSRKSLPHWRRLSLPRLSNTETKIESKPTEPVATPKSKQPQLSNEIKWAEFFDTASKIHLRISFGI